MARSTCVFVVALVAVACGGRSLEWQEAPPPADEWSDLSFAPARPDAGVMVFRDAAPAPIERPGEVDVKIVRAQRNPP